MKLSRQHFEYIADLMGPLVTWPSHIHSIADELERTNPKFNRDKFIQRATTAWENNHELPSINDNIPY